MQALADLGMSAGATSTVPDRLEQAGYARREPNASHRPRTLARQTRRAEELGEATFGPVMSGTIGGAVGCPDPALASIAEFLAAHRTLLTRYLSAVSPDGEVGPGTFTSGRAVS